MVRITTIEDTVEQPGRYFKLFPTPPLYTEAFQRGHTARRIPSSLVLSHLHPCHSALDPSATCLPDSHPPSCLWLQLPSGRFLSHSPFSLILHPKKPKSQSDNSQALPRGGWGTKAGGRNRVDKARTPLPKQGTPRLILFVWSQPHQCDEASQWPVSPFFLAASAFPM